MTFISSYYIRCATLKVTLGGAEACALAPSLCRIAGNIEQVVFDVCDCKDGLQNIVIQATVIGAIDLIASYNLAKKSCQAFYEGSPMKGLVYAVVTGASFLSGLSAVAAVVQAFQAQHQGYAIPTCPPRIVGIRMRG